jgi:hypothetical protein
MANRAAQEHDQFTVYATEAAIPRYQRAWVWGTVALAILLLGVIAGGLLSGVMPTQRTGSAQPTGEMADGTTLLIQQEAVNAQLRERITQVQQALNGDVCSPAAAKALNPDLARP